MASPGGIAEEPHADPFDSAGSIDPACRTLKGFVVGCDNLGEGAAICVPAQGRATRITHNAIATQAGDTQATGIHPLDTGDKPP